MLDKLKLLLKNIENSDEYKQWRLDHGNAYLCSAFLIGNLLDENTWQIDYYNPGNDKITSFVQNDGIKFKEENIFKKPGDEIKELDLEEVKIDLNRALKNLERLKKKKYPKEVPNQKIIVLQNLQVILWNITYINSNFNILNVKINAINGKILQDNLTSIMDFKDTSFDKNSEKTNKTAS